eukprot:g2531.t1
MHFYVLLRMTMEYYNASRNSFRGNVFNELLKKVGKNDMAKKTSTTNNGSSTNGPATNGQQREESTAVNSLMSYFFSSATATASSKQADSTAAGTNVVLPEETRSLWISSVYLTNHLNIQGSSGTAGSGTAPSTHENTSSNTNNGLSQYCFDSFTLPPVAETIKKCATVNHNKSADTASSINENAVDLQTSQQPQPLRIRTLNAGKIVIDGLTERQITPDNVDIVINSLRRLTSSSGGVAFDGHLIVFLSEYSSSAVATSSSANSSSKSSSSSTSVLRKKRFDFANESFSLLSEMSFVLLGEGHTAAANTNTYPHNHHHSTANQHSTDHEKNPDTTMASSNGGVIVPSGSGVSSGVSSGFSTSSGVSSTNGNSSFEDTMMDLGNLRSSNLYNLPGSAPGEDPCHAASLHHLFNCLKALQRQAKKVYRMNLNSSNSRAGDHKQSTKKFSSTTPNSKLPTDVQQHSQPHLPFRNCTLTKILYPLLHYSMQVQQDNNSACGGAYSLTSKFNTTTLPRSISCISLLLHSETFPSLQGRMGIEASSSCTLGGMSSKTKTNDTTVIEFTGKMRRAQMNRLLAPFRAAKQLDPTRFLTEQQHDQQGGANSNTMFLINGTTTTQQHSALDSSSRTTTINGTASTTMIANREGVSGYTHQEQHHGSHGTTIGAPGTSFGYDRQTWSSAKKRRGKRSLVLQSASEFDQHHQSIPVRLDMDFTNQPKGRCRYVLSSSKSKVNNDGVSWESPMGGGAGIRSRRKRRVVKRRFTMTSLEMSGGGNRHRIGTPTIGSITKSSPNVSLMK